MFSACIRTLLSEKHGLKFNICSIEIPIITEDVPDLTDRLSTSVSEALAYSSLFWFTHLGQSNSNVTSTQEAVSRLLCTVKLLFWLELSCLRGTLDRFTQILEECTAFFKVSWNG